MSTRKSMTFPIIIALIFLAIIIYLFVNIKQSKVSCEKIYSFDDNITLTEEVTSVIDNKKINSLVIIKTITLPDKYSDSTHLNYIKNSLENTLEYLDDKVEYSISKNSITVTIKVNNKDDLVLLNNISFSVNDDIQIKINSNTKSSDVIALSVGDTYTDGEFMKRLKNNGYRCK